jgi:signal transduction histidine kinase
MYSKNCQEKPMSKTSKKDHTLMADNLNNISTDLSFKIAIAGQGPLLLTLNAIINSAAFKHALPTITLSALLLSEGCLLPEYQTPGLQDVSIYKTAKELCLHEKDLRLVLEVSAGSAADQTDSYQVDLRRYAPKGVNLLSVSATQFICQNIEKYFVVIDDETRLYMEQKLQQSQKMVAIGELSNYLAHEIRNPIFAIGGFANALLRTPSLDDAAREKAKVILEESQRLDGILKSIINFTRPTTHDITDTDVVTVVHQTVELMALDEADRNIKFTVDIAPDIPLVHGNADLITQMLVNIIKNSQEAMPDGGNVHIAVSHKYRMVEIEIRDTGIGIAKDLQDKVFSPFYSSKGKGAGLGLSMTRKYIEDMGGQLKLESAPGQGTTLTIQFLSTLAADKPSLDIIPAKGTAS